jgi:hypothetical protein
MRYSDRLRSLLNAPEKKLLAKLSSPVKIQDYLDALPINFELDGETYMSVRRTISCGTAHCFEGALFAAAALSYHGQRPLLLDLRTVKYDEDHVVALFRRDGAWGAISKTNHAILRYRDPVYRSVRELAISYFHEYFQWDDKRLGQGQKTLREYSNPIDLSKWAPEKWVTAGEELFWLVEAIDGARHFPLVPKKNLKHLRPASKFEMRTHETIEWKPKKKLR